MSPDPEGRPDPAAPSHPEARGVLALLNGIDRALGLLCRTIIVVTGTVLAAVMTANVVARYALESGGFRFAQELPMLLFPWFIVAGITLAAQGGAHMAVEWLYGKFAGRGQAALFVFSHLCAALSFIVLAYQSVVVAAIAGFEHSPILGVPNSVGFYALALGAGLVAVVTIIAAIRVALFGIGARPQSNVEEMPL